MAHLWAKWLRHPCRLGDPHRCRAGGGGGIRSGPLAVKAATSPLPSRGSPPLQSGGQNQKRPTYGQSGYVTPAVSGIPIASERGGIQKWSTYGQSGYVTPADSGIRTAGERGGEGHQKWPTCWQSGYVTLAVSGIPTAAERGGKSEVAHLWAKRLRHPCRLKRWGESEVALLWENWLRHPRRFGDPHRCKAGGGGGGHQKWPNCWQSGYVTLAVSGIPTASERGAKSEMALLWAKWVRHPRRLGDPHRCRAGGKIRSGPLVGKVATSPPPSWGLPGGKSEMAHLWAKWLRHHCRLGDPHRLRGGGKIRSGPLWAKWLRHPCRLGDPHRFRADGKIKSGPLVGKVATPPLPSRGSPPLQSGWENQKWPTCGQSGYVTPAVSGIPTAVERGAKSEMAHLWAKWLCHPCRLGDAHRCRAGSKIRSGPLVGKVATSPLPSRGCPPLQIGGQNQKWPTYGQSGYVTPAVSGMPTAAERGGGGSGLAHLLANRLRHPCRLGVFDRYTAGGKIRSGPPMGNVATSPLPSRGSPLLQSGGQNQKWPTYGQSGYVTPAISGIPTASKRGEKSEVAHLWANSLRHPCRLGDPHRCRAGGKVRGGPL